MPDPDVQVAVWSRVGLGLEDSALAIQDILDFPQVHAVKPLSDVGAVAFVQIAFHVFDGHEVEVIHELHFDASACELADPPFVHPVDDNADQTEQTERRRDEGYPETFFHFFNLSSRSSVIGAMNLSMLPAPKVASTSTGSFLR